MIRAGARRVRTWYRRTFQNRNHIYRHDGPYEPLSSPDIRIERYERFDDIPDWVRETMLEKVGAKSLQTYQAEMADSAVLWVSFCKGEVAGQSMSRKGRFFRSWFVPLNDEDVVLFRGNTYPEFRGLGISPARGRHIMATEIEAGGKAFADCAVYNRPSMRSMEKTGYTWIATMKPISREVALGPSKATSE